MENFKSEIDDIDRIARMRKIEEIRERSERDKESWNSMIKRAQEKAAEAKAEEKAREAEIEMREIEKAQKVAIGMKMKEIEEESKVRREIKKKRAKIMRRRGFADALTKFSSLHRPRPIFVIQQELEEAKYIRKLLYPKSDQDYAAIELWKMTQKLGLKLFKGFWFGGWLVSNKEEDKFAGITFEARTAFKKRGKREVVKQRLEAGGIRHISFKGDIKKLEEELRREFGLVEETVEEFKNEQMNKNEQMVEN